MTDDDWREAMERVEMHEDEMRAEYEQTIATLRKQVEGLAGAGAQCADDLEAEINGRYGDVTGYPSLIKKREQDMAPVIAFRAALSSIRGEALRDELKK